MIKNWEEFPIGPRKPEREMHVTLDRAGTFLLGSTACDKFGPPGHVALLYDRVNSLVGMRPCSSVMENAYPVVKKSNGRHRVVRAGRFCRNHNIVVEKTVAFNKPEIDEEGFLVLDLKATRIVGKK